MHIYLGLFASLLGICISLYIRTRKQQNVKLVCPREGSCDKVVHSTFSTTLGIDNSVLGLLYYAINAVLYVLAVVSPHLFTTPVLWVMVILTCLGAFFSLYLIALQAFVIKHWCVWCLGSALASFLLVGALFGHETGELFALLSSQKIWWVILHNIGFILGLGGATITDIMFFRFLKRGVISQEQKETMDTLSNVIWIGLSILILSGIMLYLPEQARLSVSSKFLTKLVVVATLTVNGFFLNFLVSPRIRQLSLDQTLPARRFRRLAFSLGAVSISSWYIAFLLGSFRSIPISFREGVALYVSILITAVIGSIVYEHIMSHHWKPQVPERPTGQ